VPRTDQFVSLDHALPQWTATMQANVVHGGDGAIHISYADYFVTQRKFFGFALGRKFGLSSESYELGHETFQNDEIELPSYARPRQPGRLSHVAGGRADDWRPTTDDYFGCNVCAIITWRLKFSTILGSSRTSVGRLASDI
jgi:hypothetical protein